MSAHGATPLRSPCGADAPRPSAGKADGPGFGREAAFGAAWIAFETLAGQMTSLAVFACLAHLLSARDFGFVAISLALIFSLKSLLLDQSVTPVIRKAHADDVEYSTAFWINMALGALAAGLLLVFSLFADRVFAAPGLGHVMRPLALMFVGFSLSRTQEAWLSRHFRFRVLAIRTVVGVLVGAAAGLVAALAKEGVWALVIQQLVTSAVAVTLLWSTTPWRPGLRVSPPAAREILGFTFGIGGSTVLTILNQNADAALVGLLFGPDAAGVYNVGKRLKTALQMVAVAPINGVTMPTLSDAQNDPARLRRVFLDASRLILSVCAPVFLGAAAVATPLVELMFGARWAPAAPTFATLAVGGLLTVLSVYAATVLMMQHKLAPLTLAAAVQTVLTALLLLAFSWLGLHAVAAPFVLPYIVTVPICIWPGLACLGLRPREWLASIAPPLASAIAMAAAVAVLMHVVAGLSPSARLLLGVPAGIVAYAGFLFAVAPAQARRTLGDLRRRGGGADQ